MTTAAGEAVDGAGGADRADRVVLMRGANALDWLLSIWAGWRAGPAPGARLWLLWIVSTPPSGAELGDAVRRSASPELAPALSAAWPPLTPNLHTLSLDDGRVRILLAPGELRAWLAEMRHPIDTFLIDSIAPDAQGRVFKALARLAAPGATLQLGGSVAAALARAAGFVGAPWPGPPGPIGRTFVYAPTFTPRRSGATRQHADAAGAVSPGVSSVAAAAIGSPATTSSAPPVVIVGAGLAGCATAWALAELGLSSLIVEQHPTIASEASGNPAGLFHGIVNGIDGMHARFNRAAALQAASAVRIALDAHHVGGGLTGVLRLEPGSTVARMQAMIERSRLPPTYVQALDAASASQHAGLALPSPAWYYPGGGWVAPAGLARSFVERAGGFTRLHCGAQVARIEPAGAGWRLFDGAGAPISESTHVVLANAGDALRLLPDAGWPIGPVRGQLSFAPVNALPGLVLPMLPVAGAGYLLPVVNGLAVFGASSHPGDGDPTVRLEDQQHNLAQLARLVARSADIEARSLHGRTAWRWLARDRLPLVGAVPIAQHEASRLTAAPDQVRHMPRRPGLFVFTALGSRGITWAALGARTVAALVAGAPPPLEASLLDAIDPARFAVRATRIAT